VDRPVRAVAAPRPHHHPRDLRPGVAAGRHARHPVGRAPHRALRAAAGGRHLLRRILPQRAAPRVDVLLVLRRAAAPPAARPGLALRPRRGVLGRHVRARRLPRRAHVGGHPLRHPVDPEDAVRGRPGHGLDDVPGLPARDLAHRAASDRASRHQRVAQSPQKLVGRADHQRGRADVPDAPGGNVHGPGHRGSERGHRHLPRALSVHRVGHGPGGATFRHSRAHCPATSSS
jgi:hypothetical protein